MIAICLQLLAIVAGLAVEPLAGQAAGIGVWIALGLFFEQFGRVGGE